MFWSLSISRGQRTEVGNAGLRLGNESRCSGADMGVIHRENLLLKARTARQRRARVRIVPNTPFWQHPINVSLLAEPEPAQETEEATGG